MGLALEKARAAFVNGEFPVGCVVVLDKRVIADSSRQGTSGDRKKFSEIDHAEILDVRIAADADLLGLTADHGIEPDR